MMQLESVKHLLSIPSGNDSWRYVCDNKGSFIWDDLEQCVQQWNQIAAIPFGLDPVITNADEDGNLFLERKDRIEKIPLLWNPTDDLLTLHALAQLVKTDSEFRYCVDSWHGSQHAFAALPPAIWADLESALGANSVTSRFVPVPEECAGFIREMIAKRPYYQPDATDRSCKPWWKIW